MSGLLARLPSICCRTISIYQHSSAAVECNVRENTFHKCSGMKLRGLCCLIYFCQVTNSETFLEKQKRIAEEQWKREQEGGIRTNGQDEGGGAGGEAEYYYYYETDEDAKNGYEIEENIPPPPPKKNGYQKTSASVTRQPEPFSVVSLINEYKEKLNCLTQKEIGLELDRVSGRGSHSGILGVSKIKPQVNPKDSKLKKAPSNEVEAVKDKETKVANDPNQRKTFQQLQEEKKRIREGEELLQNQIDLEAGFVMGASCENRICSACEVVVEEFAQAVYAGISDPKYQYIYDITDDFCERKDVKDKYIPLVGNLCPKLLEEDTGFRNSFVLPFESESSWDDILSSTKLFPKKKQICHSFGLCSQQSYEYPSGDALEDYEKNEKCIVCHAFARDVEARLSLQVKVTEGSAVQLAQKTCDHLVLTPEQSSICQSMATGKLADDIGWITKIHSESISRKKLNTKKVVEEEIDAPYW